VWAYQYLFAVVDDVVAAKEYDPVLTLLEFKAQLSVPEPPVQSEIDPSSNP
jgi:hypothetical protein